MTATIPGGAAVSVRQVSGRIPGVSLKEIKDAIFEMNLFHVRIGDDLFFSKVSIPALIARFHQQQRTADQPAQMMKGDVA